MNLKETLATLKTYPPSNTSQAWDSADELILHHLSQVNLKGKRILILNDAFGALSCSTSLLLTASITAQAKPLTESLTTYTDSYLSSKAIQLNSNHALQPVKQLSDLSGAYDYVLVKIPKNMSFFEDQLAHLSEHLHSNSEIICGYKIKHQAKASFDLLNQYIGETHTSLAQKKARLIFARFEKSQVPSPYPLKVRMESFENIFINHSNLFSREKLDIGTRFFLTHLPQGNYPVILDLGCANGIIGIAAKRLNPSAKLILSDESWMAIQSATANYRAFFSDPAEFYWTHCFENQPAGSVNLVLCNPPFHQGHSLGDSIAKQMFIDAHSALAPGGVLQVIGNSHLPYPGLLNRIFGNSQIVATNQKFIIAKAIRD